MDFVPSADHRIQALAALKQRLEELLAEADALGLGFVGIQLSQAIESIQRDLTLVHIGTNLVNPQETPT